jgi:oligosaccharide repeat unit polymerase
MFAISTFFVLLNVNTWRFTIAPITVVVIVTSLIAFGTGELFVHLITYNQKNLYKSPKKPIQTSIIFIIGYCIVFYFQIIHYYYDTVRIAEYYGYTNGPLMLWYARRAISDPNPIKRDAIAAISLLLAETLAYIFFYIYLYNLIFFHAKKNKRNILPIIIYIPFIILGAGRTGFIVLITIGIVCGGIFYMQKNNWRSVFSFMIIKIGIFGFLLFILIFVGVGAFRRADILESGLQIVSRYIGSSILLLDHYILNQKHNNSFFGQETLFGIYGILKKIGLNIPNHYTRIVNEKGFLIPGWDRPSNIYTIIKYYLNDFGFGGSYFLLFIWGYLFAFFFQKVKYKNTYGVLFYSFAFYSVVMISIAEQFLRRFTTGTIYMVIAIIFFNYIFIDTKYLYKTMKYFFKFKSNI